MAVITNGGRGMIASYLEEINRNGGPSSPDISDENLKNIGSALWKAFGFKSKS
jgi:hypothetical protein